MWWMDSDAMFKDMAFEVPWKDMYEEMMGNCHPGLDDHRWPRVTHSVGCKPCGKFGDYPVERCLKQMDRAFNFKDNQILQIYGFTHKSLFEKLKVLEMRLATHLK
ncbi:Xyloglucan 6-xylosyltransferase 2 [Quillaja saponaria]|uniref:Xyloglucan 6-xylosyltransferase 2 n=1 Tax=Quillaja saponaria TaxID=32244 RepID=A0AAD7QFC5_QUISA|nr:Xyloglucan 6-xylosyltransferase 2 [Quillaja saponaria]